METPNYPPNNEASKKGKDQDKKLERVTSSEPVRKKKSIRKQFTETFIAGNAKSAIHYALLDILLPAAQDMVIGAVETLVRGDSPRRGGFRSSVQQQLGHIQYNQMQRPSRLSSSQRVLSRQARGQHNFDEIVLESRTEAEEVIDRLFDIVRQYDVASVAELYTLVGINSAHTDHKWGWTNLAGAGVSRVRGGYLLDLPNPHPLD